MDTWLAYAIFKRGKLLYDRFFMEEAQAYMYKLASYSRVADEDVSCSEWIKIEGITIEQVIITRIKDNGTNRINQRSSPTKKEV